MYSGWAKREKRVGQGFLISSCWHHRCCKHKEMHTHRRTCCKWLHRSASFTATVPIAAHVGRISWVCWTGSSGLWTARQLLTWKNDDGFCSACPRHIFCICRNATQEWCIYQGGQLKTNAINLIVNHEPPKCTCALWKLSVSFWLHIFWIFFLEHQGSESAVRAICKDKSSPTCRRQCNSDVCGLWLSIDVSTPRLSAQRCEPPSFFRQICPTDDKDIPVDGPCCFGFFGIFTWLKPDW